MGRSTQAERWLGEGASAICRKLCVGAERRADAAGADDAEDAPAIHSRPPASTLSNAADAGSRFFIETTLSETECWDAVNWSPPAKT